MYHYLRRVVRSRGSAVAQCLIGIALVLGAGMGQAYGQSAILDSRLTSTLTSQELLLNTNVFPIGGGLYRWQFTLQNPFANTARIRFFTAAPNCDLSQITNIQSPAGWIFQVFRQGQAPDAPKINWMVAPGQP